MKHRLNSFVQRLVWPAVFVHVLTFAGPGTALADVIGEQGDWRATIDSGAIGNNRYDCVVRSTNRIEGGRRERPRLTLNVNARRLTVDPDKSLTGLITGIAALEHRSDRHQPRRVLEHRLQIDNGATITGQQRSPRSGIWDVTPAVTDFDAFLQDMTSGQALKYEWQIDRNDKSYEFDLSDFGTLLEKLRSDPRCQTP